MCLSEFLSVLRAGETDLKGERGGSGSETSGTAATKAVHDFPQAPRLHRAARMLLYCPPSLGFRPVLSWWGPEFFWSDQATQRSPKTYACSLRVLPGAAGPTPALRGRGSNSPVPLVEEQELNSFPIHRLFPLLTLQLLCNWKTPHPSFFGEDTGPFQPVGNCLNVRGYWMLFFSHQTLLRR